MNKYRIILTESDLHRIVRESVNEILAEAFEDHNIFNVLKMLPKPVSPDRDNTTLHWIDRRGRLIKMNNTGEPLYSFIVDTGHANGYEIHTITEKACILIQNYKTKKLITVLNARPGQILRYWRKLNLEIPDDDDFKLTMRFAQNNKDRGVNNI